MTTASTEPYSPLDAWQQVRQLVDAPVRAHVQTVVLDEADTFSRIFYARMMAEPAMQRFLDHEIVNRRLHASMVRWLNLLFDPLSPAQAALDMQRKTGEVHARIGIPHSAVARGARELKRAIGQRLMEGGQMPKHAAHAVQYTYELIDLAMDCMGESATTNTTRLLRSEESYRMFFLTQDLRAERERQKSQLFEWANQMLLRNYWDVVQEDSQTDTPATSVSQFKLWVEHKAAMMFEGVPELALLRQCIESTESDLLPRLKEASANRASAKGIVAELNGAVDRMKGLLGTMFDRLTAMEDGRDSLTRLLNRRYLPAIAKREIDLAQSQGHAFALLAIDIDGFLTLRHALGVEVTDAIVAQVADRLSESVRASDFVFRVGDSQFLVLIVEAGAQATGAVAEELRHRVAEMPVRTPTGIAPDVTVSIGLAMFDGHPDYQRLLERAELALRDAQAAGRNRVEHAQTGALVANTPDNR